MIYTLISCCIVSSLKGKYTDLSSLNILAGRFPLLADSCTKLLFTVYFVYGLVRKFRLRKKSMASYSLIFRGNGDTKKTCIFLRTILIWIFTINALLIIAVNPGILNPGPNRLAVVYQNVKGLSHSLT